MLAPKMGGLTNELHRLPFAITLSPLKNGSKYQWKVRRKFEAHLKVPLIKSQYKG